MHSCQNTLPRRGDVNGYGPIDAGVFIVGIGAALYLKRKKPERFDAVGRLINEGV